MSDTTISLTDQIQADLTEALDATQRRYGVDEDTMIIHLQAVLDREIQWAKERKEEEEWEPHGWVPCDCHRACERCGGEGYVYE